MNARRILGSVIATALVATSLGVVATAAPAAAADPVRPASCRAGPTWIRDQQLLAQPLRVPATASQRLRQRRELRRRRLDEDRTTVRHGHRAASGRGPAHLDHDRLRDRRPTCTAASRPAVSNATYRVAYSGGSLGSDHRRDLRLDGRDVRRRHVQRKLIDVDELRQASRPRRARSARPARRRSRSCKKHGKKWKKFKVVRKQGQRPVHGRPSGPAPRQAPLADHHRGRQHVRPDARAPFTTYKASESQQSAQPRTGQVLASAASNLARSASTSKSAAGQPRSMPRSASSSSVPTARLRNHLLVARHDVPRRVPGVGPLDRERVRRAVVVPARPGVDVARLVLPVLLRVVQPGEQPLPLLLLADVQQALEHHGAVLDQLPLERR